MRPANHVAGQGCKKCSNNVSRLERGWLDSLGVPENCRQVRLCLGGKRYVVDALVEDTVYEFWGDKWHGNPHAI